MKTDVMLSVVCSLLIMEICSRTVEVKSKEKCRDSDECESHEEISSSEKVQIREERSLALGYSDMKLLEQQRLITGMGIRLPVHPASLFFTFLYPACPR